MFIVYFDHEYHEYHHANFYGKQWPQYNRWRAGEGAWMVPGSDPEDCFYVW